MSWNTSLRVGRRRLGFGPGSLGALDVHEIAPGLWRSTGFHQEWRENVGCVYYEAPDAVVLVDPLAPPEEPARFWAALDRDVARVCRPVHVLVTWIPEHRALVCGDVVLGDGDGGLRLCPESWLPERVGHAELRVSLRLLLDLPVERFLASHGDPVLENGHQALARLLA